MRAERLRVEHLVDPLGVGEARPRLSWELSSDREGDRQTRCRLVVASTVESAAAGVGDMWDSGELVTAATFGHDYDGAPLRAGQACHWSVQVWDADGHPSGWSAPARFEMGLLAPSDWSGAQWIGPAAQWAAPISEPPTGIDLGDWRGVKPSYLRRSFVAEADVARARVFVTARGLYELWLNGTRVGADLLRPGWTDYRVRIPYQMYDVDAQLVAGDNVLGAVMASGWFCGRVAWQDRVYGEQPSLLACLVIDYADGRQQVVTTGPGWESGPSPWLWADLLMGEAYDARYGDAGWCSAPSGSAYKSVGRAAGGRGWVPAELVEPAEAQLVASVAPPVRRLEQRPVRGVVSQWIGRWIADFGQNLTGWVKVRFVGPAGTVVKLRYAEMLEADGSLHTANLRSALATDVIVLGDGETEFEPRFTSHGFRYVEVSGLPGEPQPEGLTAVVVGSDLPVGGRFECSSPLVTQLQHNIEWSQRGNFLEVPTDCPQRDERLGWTGDIQVFLPTASCNADTSAFITKWMTDLIDTQQPDGCVADVAPVIRENLFGRAAPGWGDAVVVVPWLHYKTYGDIRLLERSFASMAAWVDYVDAANADHIWRNSRGNDYGDWLSVDADTPKDLVATAYFARSADLLSRSADALDRKDDRDRYAALAAAIRAAFQREFVTVGSRMVGDTQTAYALALRFGLVDDELRPRIAERLADDVRRRGWHLSTGFLGIAHLIPALTEADRLDLAYRLLEQDSFPSWGYAIRRGATTIWERWDAWSDGIGFKPHEMNSFNHYAYGSVGEWLYSCVAGIDQAEDSVGFERLLIRPRPGGSLRWARASRHTIRGEVAVDWRLDGADFTLDLVVPPNVSADVHLPDGTGHEVGGGRHNFTCRIDA